jgi:hypothetical protein
LFVHVDPVLTFEYWLVKTTRTAQYLENQSADAGTWNVFSSTHAEVIANTSCLLTEAALDIRKAKTAVHARTAVFCRY